MRPLINMKINDNKFMIFYKNDWNGFPTMEYFLKLIWIFPDKTLYSIIDMERQTHNKISYLFPVYPIGDRIIKEFLNA